ncbi:MAG: mucoidy inhibitor MuiA family protein [Hyphomicrobium sp.]
MRLFSSLTALLLATSSAHAIELPATSRIDAVTVFLSGAEVTRVAKVKIDKGDHTITIIDVPAGAVPGSIRVEGNATGKLEIASVDTRRSFLPRADAAVADAERKKIEDDIESLRDQKAAIDAQGAAADTQKALIANLAQLPVRPAPAAGQGQPEDWQRILSLIAQGSQEASRGLIDAQVKGRELERKIEDLENKLSALAPAKTEQTEVKVHVAAASPLEADLTIRYQVASAGWSPLYDARLQSGSKTAPPTLDLARRAAITQKSGETWENAVVQLSTARPSSGASAPELYPQTVDFEPESRPEPRPVPAAAAKAKRMDSARGMADGEGAAMEAPSELAEAAPPPPPAVPVAERTATLSVAPFEATFAVPGRVTVAGTGEAKRVVLSTEQIEPVLSSRTVPKADPKAYLYAKLTFAKGTPLLPGQVYLFRDGTFVGTGELPQLSPGEEHELGFGIDDQVKVRHAVIEEKRGETGLISSSRTDVRNYRVTVKNMHDRSINLVVLDQLPVSLNQEIKVDYLGKVQPTKANLKDKRGIMSYEAKLEPDEEKVFDYGYRISWPAAKSINFGP